jgi:hypothetical protein
VSGSGPRLTISSDVHNVSVARSFVTASLEVLDVTETDRDKAKLVTSELVTQLIATASGDDVVVEIREIPEPSFTIGSSRGLPPLPDDVVHILGALNGIGVESGEHAWTVTFERS